MADSIVETQALSRRTRRTLGITVLLAQFPLAVHLPLWISIPGMLLVLSKVLPTFDNKKQITPLVMTPLVLLAAVAIVYHYGHFFDRDPCVAFLFLLVGFKFAESKRIYDATLLVVLCAFLLLTQFFYWQTIIAAIVSIPAIFFIGLSLFAVQRGAAELDTRTMVHLTSRLMLQAIPIAMVLFVAVPRISTPGWGESGNGKSVTGLSARMSPGSISDLSKSNAVAFRVQFEKGTPSTFDLYWRGPILSGFDGREWFIDGSNSFSATTPLDQSPGDSHYTVTLEPTYNPWLPVLDTPASLPIQTGRKGSIETIAHTNRERQLNALKPLSRVTQYQATSRLTDRFTPVATPTAMHLLTTESNPRTRQWARDLRTQFSDDAMLANQILRIFNTENFSYTLKPQRLGNHAIDDFLFGTREGFCEHYAGSFVFMLRAAGIPARVVTGYQGGKFNGDYMIVRQSDAHAWAEAYIDGQWRRFDPTAAVAPERVEQGADAVLGDERANSLLSQLQPSWVKDVQLKWDSINYAWQQLVIGFDASQQNEMWKKLGLEKPSGVVIVLLILATALIWMMMILFPAKLPNRSKLDPCEAQWQVFCRLFAKKGIIRESGESPRDYVSRLISHWPQHHQSMNNLLAAYHTGRFSKPAQQKQVHKQYAKEMKLALQRIKKTS